MYITIFFKRYTSLILLLFIIFYFFFRYAKNAKRLSSLYRDRDRDPLKKAVYWVEYVAKYRVNLMLKPTTQEWWYERCLLDVVFVVFVTVTFMAYLAKWVLFKSRMATTTDQWSSIGPCCIIYESNNGPPYRIPLINTWLIIYKRKETCMELYKFCHAVP